MGSVAHIGTDLALGYFGTFLLALNGYRDIILEPKLLSLATNPRQRQKSTGCQNTHYRLDESVEASLPLTVQKRSEFGTRHQTSPTPAPPPLFLPLFFSAPFFPQHWVPNFLPTNLICTFPFPFYTSPSTQSLPLPELSAHLVHHGRQERPQGQIPDEARVHRPGRRLQSASVARSKPFRSKIIAGEPSAVPRFVCITGSVSSGPQQQSADCIGSACFNDRCAGLCTCFGTGCHHRSTDPRKSL